MTDHKVDIQRLEKQITDVSDALAHLGTKEDFLHLIRIIHRPGWTTPAELAFLRASLEAMHAQARAMQAFRAELVRASEQVGVREAETIR